MGKINVFLGLILLIFIANNCVNTTKLNYPRVLLPIFDKISINFTLQVIDKGCFKWTSSRQDLILITPLYEDLENECSYRATVTVLTRERRRNTAIVLAEDMATGESQRCDVILDVIDRLGVHTTTRQLYLEEAPETFELRAEDSQGNAFTTLEGIEFNWAITSLNPDSKSFSPALRFITFSESVYHEVPATLEKFEALGIKGYMVLLEGINTGTAKVTVNMPHTEYKHVAGIEVYINVLANIILEPSDVHMLAGDTINFRILQLKMGKLHEISLNDQYFLEIKDTKIASINGNAATAYKLGRSTVVLRDRNVPNDGSFTGDNAITEASVPSARITVSEPHKLGISFLPHNNWITVEGERHTIAFDLYTKDDHKITLGSQYAVKSEFDTTLYFVLNKGRNGSRLYGEAVKAGTTPVFGKFKTLTADAELQIYESLTLEPSKVILPYDPNMVKTQRIQFEAKGGDGAYIWHTQQPRILQINQQGLATTTIRDMERKMSQQDYMDASGTLLTAQSTIRVSLAKNQKISRQAEVYFLPPVRLEILKYNFETALDDYVHLHVAVYAYANGSYVPYTKCDNLIFDLELSNQIFQLDYTYQKNEKIAGACQVVHLRSTAIGLTHLRLSYKFQDKLLKDEVTLSVFEPLTLLNPIEGEIVLPIGASRNIIFANGQQKIFTLDAELTKTTIYDLNIAQVTEFEFDNLKGLYAFTVLCREAGETNLTFNINNMLVEKNFQAYVSTVQTQVYCVKPRFLNLYATKQLRSSCPLEMKNSLLHLQERDDKFEIEIEVQDAKNRKLMNISSLLIDWEFAANEQHYHKDRISHTLHSEEELYEGIRLPSKDVLLINPSSDLAANFRVKGIVSNYNDDILQQYKIYPEFPVFGIKNTKTGTLFTPQIANEIRFMAVNSTLFSRDHLSIFMAKNRLERIPLRQGSGYYDYNLSEDGIVGVQLDSKHRELIIRPLRVGNVRIELADRCLMNEPAVLSVSVVSIGAIDVHVADRVERFKSIEAIVQLYDSNDELLQIDAQQLDIYDLSEDIYNPGILSMHLGEQTELGVGEIRYIITGNNLGESKIVFHSGSGSTMVSSEPANIQVFPPLRLYPRNSTLVVGSNVQIYHLGGPQPTDNILYYVHDKQLITMDSAIVTAHRLGATKITGKCLMKSPTTGKDIVICEDTIEVHVVPLVDISIKTPLSEIRSGAVMPAAVWGVPNLSPMVLGTLANMQITWSTNQPDVIDIYNIFADAGIEYSETNLISVRIKALNPGKAKIHASVQLPNGQRLTTAVEVIVFKILELESPRHITMDWILVAPRSAIQLKANLDDVLYKTDSESKSIVKVTPDGILRSHDTLGRDLIIAKTAKQTLPIGVEVKNVQYILASLEYPTLKLKQTESQIPRGMNFILKVSMHDNLGNEFSHNIEDVNGIKYELSHKDIVDVQIGNNWTLALNLPRETNNMIAISLKDTTGVKHAEDFIKLSVADSPYIYPTKTIFSVGDIICFDSPLTLSSVWKSSDEKIISIDRLTGIAKVLGNRFKLGEKIVVTNGDKASGSFIKYDVEVRDADVIQFSKSFDIFSGQNYRAHLVLRNHLQLDKFANLIAKNVSTCKNALENLPIKLFKCQLKSKQALAQQLLQHYKVTPLFEFESGRYACHVELNASFNEVLNIVKTNDVHFELVAQLENGLTDSISLKFVPGIKVTPEALLSTHNIVQELLVTGLDKVLQKVTVKSSDAELLNVNLETKAHGLLKYKIQILKELPADEQQLFVNVNSPTTLQDIQIPVLGTGTQIQKCSAQYIENTTEFIFTVLSKLGYIVVGVVLLAVTILVYFYYNPYGVRETNKEAFSKSGTASRQSSFNASASTSPSSQRGNATPIYKQQSPYFDNRASPTAANISYSPRNDSQVYGDTTLISPQKRINRRFL